jgi:hypothetical protein
MKRPVLACCAAVLLLAACATPPPAAPDKPGERTIEPPSLGLFSRIRVPDGHEPALQLAARGVQIFRCERIGNEYEWRFRQPEAELFDVQGQSVGRHGANFSFEHRDGSRLLGTVVAHEKAASADTLPWLLLSAKSFGKGALGGVSYVQRVNTRGGMPPPACGAEQANRLLRVDFTADFVFYRPRS